jgi:plasmid maintenance system killer protein
VGSVRSASHATSGRVSPRASPLAKVIEFRLSDLRVPPGNRLEALKGRWKGFYSIRINDQWRVVFRFKSGDASDVRVVDYH